MRLLVTILSVLAFLLGAPLYAQWPPESPEAPKQTQKDVG